jgi:signal transduction histidine kinase
VDLDAIVADVGRQAQLLFSNPARGVTIELEHPARVCGDPDTLKQLLWILLDNASRVTAAGGRIELRVGQDGVNAHAPVADDGPGIRERDLERIFERFYQADASRGGSGAGLGLSIARWIAQEHGGQLAATNRSAGGAIFTLELPLLANS